MYCTPCKIPSLRLINKIQIYHHAVFKSRSRLRGWMPFDIVPIFTTHRNMFSKKIITIGEIRTFHCHELCPEISSQSNAVSLRWLSNTPVANLKFNLQNESETTNKQRMMLWALRDVWYGFLASPCHYLICCPLWNTMLVKAMHSGKVFSFWGKIFFRFITQDVRGQFTLIFYTHLVTNLFAHPLSRASLQVYWQFFLSFFPVLLFACSWHTII